MKYQKEFEDIERHLRESCCCRIMCQLAADYIVWLKEQLAYSKKQQDELSRIVYPDTTGQ